MAGSDPGMVVRVAADITDFQRTLQEATAVADATFHEISAAAEGTATDQRDVNAAVTAGVTAYGNLQAEGVPTMHALATETSGAEQETLSLETSLLAAGVAVGVLGAALIGAGIRQAAEWMKDFSEFVLTSAGVTQDLTDNWKEFKAELATSIQQTGVIKAGYDSLKASILQAFGGDTQGVIAGTTSAVNAIGIKAVDVGMVLVDWAGTAIRLFGMVKGPIDALTVAFNYVVTGFLDGVALMAGAASHLPFVGAEWAEVQTKIGAYADSWREVRDRTLETMRADDEMVKGQGPVHTALATTKGWLTDMKVAMQEQEAAAAAATTSTQDLAAANLGLVEGTGEATVALYNQNEQLAKMDDWNRKIKNSHPWGVLLDGLTKVLPPLDATTTKANDAAAAAFLMGDHMSRAAPKLTGLGKAAIDMSDDVHFAAEVIADATATTLSWSGAMDLVRQGKGTMTGTIGKPTKPAGMSTMEFQQMQTDPRTWEIMHGWDWQSPGGTGSTWNWLDWQQPGGGGQTTTQNITVNTVMGDKHEIARVVKDALADDWRTTGTRA